jgi:hypothetical protein
MARLDLFWITLASMATVISAIITPYGWVLGNGGETCVQACSRENMGACDPKGFDAISNDDALKTVGQMIKGGCGYFTPEHVDQEYAPYLRPPKGDPQERCVRIVNRGEDFIQCGNVVSGLFDCCACCCKDSRETSAERRGDDRAQL